MRDRGVRSKPARRARHAARQRWTSRLVAAAFCTYAAIVVNTERVMGRAELFPFASFSLFSTVPNVVHDYGIRVRTLGGNGLGKAAWFEESFATFPYAHDHEANTSITRFGRLAERGGAAEAAAMRRWLESTWLRHAGSGPLVYDLCERRYDPLARARDGTFLSVRRVATFRTGDAGPASTKGPASTSGPASTKGPP